MFRLPGFANSTERDRQAASGPRSTPAHPGKSALEAVLAHHGWAGVMSLVIAQAIAPLLQYRLTGAFTPRTPPSAPRTRRGTSAGETGTRLSSAPPSAAGPS